MRTRNIPQKHIPIAKRLNFAVIPIEEDDEEIMTTKVVGRKPVSREVSEAEKKQLKLLRKKKKFTGKRLTDSRIAPLLEAVSFIPSL